MKIRFTALLLLLIGTLSGVAQNAAEIKLKIERLKTCGAVLYIAAHPDDENTRLLAYLANELKVRTAYLSLTRGDGGQNLIGTEQSEKLGMIRTQELLAARSVDGAEQYFTRAFDFGFSKGPDETLNIWQKDSVIADMVWVIRNFKPDVIITRFPTDGSGGHGHHTSSAILAEIAMDAAADPNQYKEQLNYTSVWKVKRLVWNGFNFGGRPQSDGKDFTKLDIGGYNPLLGKSYGEIASTSRSQHKSQGFGVPMQRGSTVETFKYVKGDSVKNSIFDGIDFTWSKYKEAKKIDLAIDQIIAKYNPSHPEQSIKSLITLDTQFDKLENEYWRAKKKQEIQEIIVACAGLFLDLTSSEYFVSPSHQLKVNIQTINRSTVNVELKRVQIDGVFDSTINASLVYNKLMNYNTKVRIPSDKKYSNPYWLEQAPSKGLVHVAKQQEIGMPFNEPNFKANFYLNIEGKEYTIQRALKYKWTDDVRGELYRSLEVIPPVQMNFTAKNLLFVNAESKKKLQVMLHTNKSDCNGIIKLSLPQGWVANPKEIAFESKSMNATLTFEFEVAMTTANPSAGKIIPIVSLDGKEYSETVERIQYEHIPTQVQVKKASINIEKIDVQTKGKRAGYIPGAGDEIPEALKNLGFEVVRLTDEYLSNQSLYDLDVIVAGIRLYNTNDNMQAHYNKLMDYVSKGGNYVVQYNTNNFISTVPKLIGPYPFTISRDRVTDEHANMSFINPADPLLNYPNKITQTDFDNWVQERGLYFVNAIDANYTKTFVCNDPNEKPNEGILISCKYGKGVFTYTGIAFFRQLPAGVPGAYRLFANIISQTK